MEQLSEERLHLNHQALNGLYYALMPRRSSPDFESYLEDLAHQEPGLWIDHLFESYERMSMHGCDLDRPAREVLLADFDTYLQFLSKRFNSKHIEVEVERQAYEWLSNPEQMQQLALDHLRFMWQEYLKLAWDQGLPLLEESLRSFHQVDWPGAPSWSWLNG